MSQCPLEMNNFELIGNDQFCLNDNTKMAFCCQLSSN